MKATVHTFKDVSASVFLLDRGERVPRHQHFFEHTTACARGESEVCIGEASPIIMHPGDTDMVLPADVEHEIRALVDGTVVINMAPAFPG